QRQDDVVLGRGGLQFEIELAAEALAQRQAPGAVEPPAERRMHDKLLPAGLVEKAFEHDAVLRRHGAKRRQRGGEIFDKLTRGGFAEAELLRRPGLRRL